MAQNKATKKFEKRHLQDTLKRRNEFKKVKQRHQLKDKKKARREAEGRKKDAEEDVEDKSEENADRNREKVFENMSVDDLFAGGFELAKPASAQKRPTKRKRNEADDEDVELSGESVGSNAAPDSDAASEPEDEDELKAHMKELDELSKKDPEFYKYLKENDPELLDVDQGAKPEHELELSADEDEDTKGKKKSKEQEEVTSALVKRWGQALEHKKSLRVVREVATAFRAAAHLHDDEGKDFRYAITDANGEIDSVAQ